SRIVTITGNELAHPRNLEVRFGTPFRQLLNECGLDRKIKSSIIMGGPLMGMQINNDAVPVIKTTNCILAMKQEPTEPVTMPCIRCGECARVCPVNLLPQQLYWYSRARDFEHVQDYNLFDCIECGCCAYVCPSKIPLVTYYRFAKTEIWAQERDKLKSDHARERHEFRQYRMERKKKEDEERKLKKKELLQKTTGTADDIDSKKAAIEAAMARVKAKQTQQEHQKQNTDNLTEAQQQAIKEIEERRKRSANTSSDPSSESDPH
ncbi:MAG: 4Fe-4S dicluster domain-containing protein, partial [Gammaproteobacteria bacterium]|nr:4Fe-4S dicluster domain-containing protein [Gammaproteobacteria bacterium]